MYIVFRSFWARTISIFFVIQAWPCPVATYKLSNLLSIVPSISTEWFTLRFHQKMQLGNAKNEASKSWGKSPNSMRTPCFHPAARSVVIHALVKSPIFGCCLSNIWWLPFWLSHVITCYYHFLLVHSYVFFLESHFWVDKMIRHGFCSCLRPIHYGKMRKLWDEISINSHQMMPHQTYLGKL